MGFLGIITIALLVVLITSIWKVLLNLVWRPYYMTEVFRKQGLRGPAYKFGSGSMEEMNRIRKEGKDLNLDKQSHDITARVLPHHHKWMEQYGRMYVFWVGTQPRIWINDIEMVKQVLSSKFGFFVKPEFDPSMMALLGKGLVFVEGSDWARHRRIVNHAFTMDKLKMLANEMVGCTKLMLEDWHAQILQEENQHKEIEVGKQFEELTTNIISHTGFGSSYMEGKEVFLVQQKLQVLAAEGALKIRYLPTKSNLCRWKLEKTLRKKLMGIIKGRLESKKYTFGNDLLGLMMKANAEQDGQTMTMDEILDECKTFFFAGNETTSQLLTWTMFLLSMYPDWQEKLRKEVNMVLLKSLRLYCPFVMMERKATEDVTLGNINVPKDTVLQIPVAVIHTSKEIWGVDATEFNPIRFQNGVAKASMLPNALLAFSIGPRGCIGQNFAMLEAKIVIAMILQRFSFSLSENYKHAPLLLITLQPEYGLPVVFRPLDI